MVVMSTSSLLRSFGLSIFFLAIVAIGALVSWRSVLLHPAPPGQPLPTLPPVVSRTFGDLRVHLVNTGWVRVKEAHRELQGSEALRFPGILLARDWTEFMPVYVAVIEHPEGVFLVDSGLSEELLQQSHFDCDPGTAFVYSHLLDFRFEPSQRIDQQLNALGIDTARLKGVVMTHRHADHTEGYGYLPSSVPAYVGAKDWPTHNGALPCRWPAERTPILVPEDGGPALEAFPHSRPLTKDGRLAIVPLTGHSPGHLAVVLRTGTESIIFAGDAAFNVRQVREHHLAGIVEVADAARRSLEILEKQLIEYRSILVLSHNPELALRFGEGQPTPIGL
jgi:glyoxylase-like metal-dependent hydrolase (beta-lactamase superfamily II)